MSIFITGVAGFIGYHVCEALLKRGETIIGVDNLNSYYDVQLKKARLNKLKRHKKFTFHRLDITDGKLIEETMGDSGDVDKVIHLAAQAGVRYSLENPTAYIETNILGHFSVLKACIRLESCQHLVYASSSSVYGGNTDLPFSINDRVDHPVSIYAATKRADELISDSYSHLYRLPQTGLRLFTVYGPWGRPDMAYYSFTKAIFEGKPIRVFNYGDMKRDFTYIDDIVNGVLAALDSPPVDNTISPPHKIYNLGNNKSESLMHFINVIENAVGKKAIIDLQPMQPGDVKETYADITESKNDLNFKPTISIDEGIPRFVSWFKEYYRV